MPILQHLAREWRYFRSQLFHNPNHTSASCNPMFLKYTHVLELDLEIIPSRDQLEQEHVFVVAPHLLYLCKMQLLYTVYLLLHYESRLSSLEYELMNVVDYPSVQLYCIS